MLNLETIIDKTSNYSVQSSSNNFHTGSTTSTGTNDSHSTSSYTYTPGPFDYLFHPTAQKPQVQPTVNYQQSP